MHTPESKWEWERAAWLRGRGSVRPEPPQRVPPPAPQAGQAEQGEIDIAGWPALVAPFYD